MSKERGLICCASSVRAFLDDRKSQTRRTRGLDYINKEPDIWGPPYFNPSTQLWEFLHKRDDDVLKIKCPYGVVGDRLYIREMWWDLGHMEKGEWCGRIESHTVKPRYVATCPDPFIEGIGGVVQPVRCHWKQTSLFKSTWRKRPAIFMPKWAVRIWRTITGIRGERVQDISDADAEAEGLRGLNSRWNINGHERSCFGCHWDSINKKRGYGWDANPWNWVLELSRTEK